ncbi:hypothetical protein LX32DRAFT_36669 [Colletotrichum zoysiae]|uniref:Uncharacterized protein n=1 Tax=Colletotrichum zoysiae TaxID=1216348 RepID=A0AAD9HBZ0_9PEZI|nr:hypothetical protein LX32DRAFT_36669 [Colletotrichum zoysiae]
MKSFYAGGGMRRIRSIPAQRAGLSPSPVPPHLQETPHAWGMNCYTSAVIAKGLGSHSIVTARHRCRYRCSSPLVLNFQFFLRHLSSSLVFHIGPEGQDICDCDPRRTTNDAAYNQYNPGLHVASKETTLHRRDAGIDSFWYLLIYVPGQFSTPC